MAAAADKLSLDDWPGQPVALVTKNVSDFPQSAFQDTSVVRYREETVGNEAEPRFPTTALAAGVLCERRTDT